MRNGKRRQLEEASLGKRAAAVLLLVGAVLAAVWGVHHYRYERLPQTQLQNTAARLVRAITATDPAALLALCSQQGVAFGVDQPPMPLAEIRRQMDGKIAAYCAFFDTACARQEDAAGRQRAGAPPPLAPVYSYRERLLTGGPTRIAVGVSGQFGSAIVYYNQSTGAAATIEFDFIREAGGWKLAAVPYW